MAKMAEDPRRSAERRRAAELLAASPDGCTAAILLAHRFKADRLVELINAGLASVTTERRVAGDRRVEITRVRITDARRQALKQPQCGRSRQGAPDRKTQKMPFRTRRSFTRGTPRGLFGSIGLMAAHSWSVSS